MGMLDCWGLVARAGVVAMALATTGGCAMYKRDRCYLAETRYMLMRDQFEETGSYERVAQAMKDDQWSRCEVNQFRYRLRKDLGLEGPEFAALIGEFEPDRKALDYHPGVVRKTVDDNPRYAQP